MTKDDISIMLLHGVEMGIIEINNIFYIYSFCFDNSEDIAVYYNHDKIFNPICICNEGKYYVVEACFLSGEDAKRCLSDVLDRWNDKNHHLCTYPTEMTFLRDWFSDEYIRKHWPEEVAAEEKRMFNK